jgi:hypothetical protein
MERAENKEAPSLASGDHIEIPNTLHLKDLNGLIDPTSRTTSLRQAQQGREPLGSWR